MTQVFFLARPEPAYPPLEMQAHLLIRAGTVRKQHLRQVPGFWLKRFSLYSEQAGPTGIKRQSSYVRQKQPTLCEVLAEEDSDRESMTSLCARAQLIHFS